MNYAFLLGTPFIVAAFLESPHLVGGNGTTIVLIVVVMVFSGLAAILTRRFLRGILKLDVSIPLLTIVLVWERFHCCCSSWASVRIKACEKKDCSHR